MGRQTPETLRTVAVLLNTITSVTVTLHVLFIHQKFVEKSDEKGNAYIELQDTENVEQYFLITAVLVFILSFALLAWADREQVRLREERFRRLEGVLRSGNNSLSEIDL